MPLFRYLSATMKYTFPFSNLQSLRIQKLLCMSTVFPISFSKLMWSIDISSPSVAHKKNPLFILCLVSKGVRDGINVF